MASFYYSNNLIHSHKCTTKDLSSRYRHFDCIKCFETMDHLQHDCFIVSQCSRKLCLPFITGPDSDLRQCAAVCGTCGTCGAACPVEAVLNAGQRRLLESTTGQWQRQKCSVRLSFKCTETPLTRPPQPFQNDSLFRQYTGYLEPFVGFPGRRLLEASPSSLRLNPGGPPSWNEKGRASRLLLLAAAVRPAHAHTTRVLLRCVGKSACKMSVATLCTRELYH